MPKEEKKPEIAFRFKATGVGSVPFLDTRAACHTILTHCPEIPFWPQLVKRSYQEEMRIQFSEGLPCIKNDEKGLHLSLHHMESELVSFYDRFLSEDIDSFALNREYAPGLYQTVEYIQAEPERFGPFIKGQSIGPVTFICTTMDSEGRPLLHYPDLVDAAVKGLAIKALWQVNYLGRTGKRVMIFLDEPYLAGFGSAFSSIQRHEVLRILQEVIHFLRERSNAFIGIHCCGNTDWPMLIEAGPDIINFDAFSYLDYFLLYPEELSRFIHGGGIIAWGIVPTYGFSGKETLHHLSSRLEEGLSRLYQWGLDPERVSRQALLTPACGMGTMGTDSAEKVLHLLASLSDRFKAGASLPAEASET